MYNKMSNFGCWESHIPKGKNWQCPCLPALCCGDIHMFIQGISTFVLADKPSSIWKEAHPNEDGNSRSTRGSKEGNCTNCLMSGPVTFMLSCSYECLCH